MWQNYIRSIFVSSTLIIGSWSIGYFNFSFFWIIFFIVFYIVKIHMSSQKEKKRSMLQNIIIQEKKFILTQLGYKLQNLPAWVQFPDIERIEGLNKVVQQLWPYIGDYAKKFLFEFFEPEMRSMLPKPFRSFKFIEINCGELPCRFGGLKVYTENVGKDRIILDFDVIYAGDAQISVKICGFVGGINNIILKGKIRCVLQPLLPHPPLIGGITFAFIDLPKFDFNLIGMGEFVQLPGLIHAVHSVINAQTANLCVLPNTIFFPLVPNIDVTKLYFPNPEGVIQIKIIEAKNLENKDFTFFSHKNRSDPYCEIQIGAQCFKTQTVNNNLNPIFNESFEAVVDQACVQTLRIIIFDKDTAKTDEELGRLLIPLKVVQKSGEIDNWFYLEGCKHGELRLKIVWLNLSTNLKNIEHNFWENDWQKSNDFYHTALLMVFVDKILGLPNPKLDVEPSPFLEINLDQMTQRTSVKTKTTNPIYQSKFFFFVKNLHEKKLKIKAFDNTTHRELGDLNIPLSNIIQEPNLEFFQQTFPLTQGVHSSKIVLTIRLRTFTSLQLPQNEDKTSDYGTGFHIERADRKVVSKNNNSLNKTNYELQKKIHEDAKNKETKLLEKKKSDLIEKKNSSLSLSSISATIESEKTSLANTKSSSSAKILNKLKGQIGANKKIKKVSNQSLASNLSGQIQISLRYDEIQSKLHINIINARNLVAIEKKKSVELYVTLQLISLDSSVQSKEKKKTKSIKNTLNPQFDEHVQFDINYTELLKYKLKILVKDSFHNGMFNKSFILGEVEIKFENFLLNTVVNKWFDLKNSCIIRQHHS